MAIWQRKPKAGLIWHTDRGSQYISDSHRAITKQYHIKQSMSYKGDCWDNAVAESCFGNIKTELMHQHTFKTRDEAKHVIFEYIEVFYNRVRIHSANDYLSPVYYEPLNHCHLKCFKKLYSIWSGKLLPDHITSEPVEGTGMRIEVCGFSRNSPHL